MARISVEELYRGEGVGAKYGSGGIIGAFTKEMRTCGVPENYDEQTWLEMLIVKFTLAAAEKNEKRGRLCIGNDRCGVALFLCEEERR